MGKLNITARLSEILSADCLMLDGSTNPYSLLLFKGEQNSSSLDPIRPEMGQYVIQKK